MGITKAALFTTEQNTLANAARVLGHPARIAILQYLLQSPSCINRSLVEEIGLSQPSISQHLRELKEIGLIQGTIDGVSMKYCIHPEKWIEIRNLFQAFLNSSPIQNTCC